MGFEYDIASRSTAYGGAIFRSRLEARWAAFFDLIGQTWTYEPCVLAGWVPDFLWRGIYCEVKPVQISERENVIRTTFDKALRSSETILLGLYPEAVSAAATGFEFDLFGDDRAIGLTHTANNKIEPLVLSMRGGDVAHMWKKACNRVRREGSRA